MQCSKFVSCIEYSCAMVSCNADLSEKHLNYRTGLQCYHRMGNIHNIVMKDIP